MKMITTGTVFQSMDSFGRKAMYRFKGIDINDETAHRYLILENIKDARDIEVSFNWFQNHSCTVLKTELRVKNGTQYGYVLKCNENYVVVRVCKSHPEKHQVWEIKDITIC